MPVATTHHLTFGQATVTKRYSRWDRGEPKREWEALTVIHRRRPALVPAPLSCDLGDEAPFITMSRLPGEPLGGRGSASNVCLDAVTVALTAFHRALAPSELAKRDVRVWSPAAAVAEIAIWAEQEQTERNAGELEETIGLGLAEGARWVQSAWPSSRDAPVDLVFGRGDGNAGNLLWDGEQVRLVDFEDAGVSDLAFELADTAEHISWWIDDDVDTEAFLARFELDATASTRLTEFRRLFGLFWLLMLLPGNPAHARNPPGTGARQADRLLRLLARRG